MNIPPSQRKLLDNSTKSKTKPPNIRKINQIHETSTDSTENQPNTQKINENSSAKIPPNPRTKNPPSKTENKLVKFYFVWQPVVPTSVFVRHLL